MSTHRRHDKNDVKCMSNVCRRLKKDEAFELGRLQTFFVWLIKNPRQKSQNEESIQAKARTKLAVRANVSVPRQTFPTSIRFTFNWICESALKLY